MILYGYQSNLLPYSPWFNRPILKQRVYLPCNIKEAYAAIFRNEYLNATLFQIRRCSTCGAEEYCNDGEKHIHFCLACCGSEMALKYCREEAYILWLPYDNINFIE